MTIQGMNPTNQSSIFMPASGGDQESKALQKEIDEKQKELKELSQNEDIPLEEKVKQKQKLQQEISQLEAQLKMHQQEMKQQKQQESATQNPMSSGGDRQSLAVSMSLSSEGTAMSGMESLLSAHSSLKQAKVQQGVSKSLHADARILESEIKQDKGNGMNVEQKEEQLEKLNQRSSDAMNLAASSLQAANQSVKETKAGDGKQDDKGENTGTKREEEEEKLAKDDKQSKQEEKNKLSEE